MGTHPASTTPTTPASGRSGPSSRLPPSTPRSPRSARSCGPSAASVPAVLWRLVCTLGGRLHRGGLRRGPSPAVDAAVRGEGEQTVAAMAGACLDGHFEMKWISFGLGPPGIIRITAAAKWLAASTAGPRNFTNLAAQHLASSGYTALPALCERSGALSSAAATQILLVLCKQHAGCEGHLDLRAIMQREVFTRPAQLPPAAPRDSQDL